MKKGFFITPLNFAFLCEILTPEDEFLKRAIYPTLHPLLNSYLSQEMLLINDHG